MRAPTSRGAPSTGVVFGGVAAGAAAAGDDAAEDVLGAGDEVLEYDCVGRGGGPAIDCRCRPASGLYGAASFPLPATTVARGMGNDDSSTDDRAGKGEDTALAGADDGPRAAASAASAATEGLPLGGGLESAASARGLGDTAGLAAAAGAGEEASACDLGDATGLGATVGLGKTRGLAATAGLAAASTAGEAERTDDARGVDGFCGGTGAVDFAALALLLWYVRAGMDGGPRFCACASSSLRTLAMARFLAAFSAAASRGAAAAAAAARCC